MFGYVMPLKDELRVREFEVFKSYYCSLCNTIGKKSYISKMTLTYDMTFLSILLSSIYMDYDETFKHFCPYKFRNVNMVNTNKYIEYAADMNIILSNRKLLDNYRDDKNYFALIASKVINTKKLTNETLSMIKEIDKHLANISKLEKEKSENIDEISNEFALICEKIFDIYGKSAALRVLGYNIGKWIYLIDAYDDIKKDIKSGSYNPFIYAFKYESLENVDEFKERILENAEFTLIRCLSEASAAFDIIDINKNKEILENIIYLGLDRQTTKVLRGGCCSEKSIRSIRA